MTCCRLLKFFLIVIIWTISALPAAALSYNNNFIVNKISTYGGEFGNSAVPQINNKGQVAFIYCYYENGIRKSSIKLYTDGNISTVVSGYSDIQSISMNNNGQIAWFGDGNLYIYDGTATKLISNNISSESKIEMNNTGQIVWVGHDGTAYQVYLYSNGSVRQISNGNFDNSAAIYAKYPRINNNGKVVWPWTSCPGGVLYLFNSNDNSTTTIVPQYNNIYSFCYVDINDYDHIVWTAWDSASHNMIYLYSNGATNQIPSYPYSNYYGNWDAKINNRGKIVWEASTSRFEIALYNSNETIYITQNSSSNNFNPAINDKGQIVWEDWDYVYLATPIEYHYLSFDQSPPNPVTVGTAFPITITAHKIDGTLDTSFNSNVTLSCPGLQLDTSSVNFANGIWTGNLTITQGEGANLVIQAQGGGLSGKSYPFSTSGAATGNLYGLVTDDGALTCTPLPNATVHLSASAGGPDDYPAQTTDANGRFSFTGVAAGSYYLWATYNSASSPTGYQITVSAGSMSKSLTIPTAGDTSKLPVILIPGIVGSNDKDRYGVYPRLLKSNYDRNQLQLHDPGQFGVYDISPGWRNLKEILGPHGTNVKVVDCPWDWRMPIDAAMKKYLKDAIREAKGGNANQKFNIIAHSMGGLLARAYIQGDDYQNDVENLVMVGTPNKGSANAYYIWEGGDPESVDARSHPNIWFYTKTIKKLMQDLKWPLTGEQDYLNKRNFISSHVRTAKQLLPTYAFLDHGSGPQPITSSGNINQDLKDLNNDPRRSDRMGPPNNTEGKVKTRVYYSDTESTVGDVFVRNTTIHGCYEDGEPNGTVWSYSGDGTVFYQSAILPVNDTTKWGDAVSVPGSHVKLVNNAKDLIANFLYPQPTTTTFPKAAAATPSASFFITFNGWLQPYLTDSQGRALGFNLTSGALVNTIPQARLVTEADGGSLAVDNPTNGLYTLSLKGNFPGVYRLTLDYMDSANVVSQEVEGFNNANTTAITILVDSANPAKIIINPVIAAPASVEASNDQGKARLTWQLSTGAVSYQIYALLPGSSDYVLIGTTANTNFLTNDLWLTDASATPTVYVVVAVKADGTTSFFSDTAANKSIPKKKMTISPIMSLLLTD